MFIVSSLCFLIEQRQLHYGEYGVFESLKSLAAFYSVRLQYSCYKHNKILSLSVGTLLYNLTLCITDLLPLKVVYSLYHHTDFLYISYSLNIILFFLSNFNVHHCTTTHAYSWWIQKQKAASRLSFHSNKNLILPQGPEKQKMYGQCDCSFLSPDSGKSHF